MLKQVPEIESLTLDEETGRVRRQGVDSVINPLDLYALEAALKTAQENPRTSITAFTMGPPSAVMVLKEALAMGAHGAVLLSDRVFGGADTFATARVLTAALKKAGPFDLILCGEKATDGDTGQVGPEIAALLKIPAVTFAGSILPEENGTFIIRRLVERGIETLRLHPPGVVTVTKAAGEPRLPTLKGKRIAREREIPQWKAEDLAINPQEVGLSGSPTRVEKVHHATLTRDARILTAVKPEEKEQAVTALLAFLEERRLIPGEGER